MVRAVEHQWSSDATMDQAASRRADLLLMGADVSLVDDSLSDDISELDKNSVHLPGDEKLQNESRRPSGMAPITTIETITIVRPLKVIAFICGALAILLLVLCLASSEWLLAQGWRQGLFVHCVSEDAIHPLPFGISSDAGCYAVRTRGYIISSAILCIVAVILDSLATLLTGMGLWSQDSVNKYKYYRIALYIMIGSLVSVLIALIIYPVFFSGELQHGNRDLWEFGWAYGVAWGAAIFLFGGIVLLLLDKESEEIYYKERTVVQESQAGSDAASTSNKG